MQIQFRNKALKQGRDNIYEIIIEVSKIRDIHLAKDDSKLKIGNSFVQVSYKNNIRFNSKVIRLDRLRKMQIYKCEPRKVILGFCFKK